MILIGITCLPAGFGMGADMKAATAVSIEKDVEQVKFRFYRGFREAGREPVMAVTASSVEISKKDGLHPITLLSEEKEQLEKVFKLDKVELITEADLIWRPDKPNVLKHVYRFENKEYFMRFERKKKSSFQVQINEQSEMESINLLDVEMTLPADKVAFFGFEDKQGNPLFVSLGIPNRKIVKKTAKAAAEREVKTVAVRDIAVGDPEVLKKALKVRGELKPPKLAKLIKPVYPEEAREKKVEGIVILEAATDTEGDVAFVKVIRGMDKALNHAAVNAVKQWKYEPVIIEGDKKSVSFTVTVTFRLEEDAKRDYPENAVVLDKDETPKIVKKVQPQYPQEARKNGVEGAVELEFLIDEKGLPVKVMVISSESSLLNEAAVNAVKQWVFEPYTVDGEIKPAVSTVKIKFKLQ